HRLARERPLRRHPGHRRRAGAGRSAHRPAGPGRRAGRARRRRQRAAAADAAQGSRWLDFPPRPGSRGVRAAALRDPGLIPMARSGEQAAQGGDNDSLGAQIAGMIERLPPDHVTLGELLDLFGDEGLLLLCILLTLVFLIPVSIPGVSTVFGAAILLVGV